MTSYIKVKWNHSHKDEPVLLYSELDGERYETRKVEIYADNHFGYADKTIETGSTMLGDQPTPPLKEIAALGEFDPVEITKEEFEEVWKKCRK